MSRLIGIGDIHGCIKTLKELLYSIVKIEKTDKLIFLGDYIDRGHSSKEVLDEMIYIKENYKDSYFIRGNHEQMLINTYYHPEIYPQWFRNGASETLSSFGIDDIVDLPERYLQFILHTEYYIELEDYIFVHSGLNFEIEDPLKDIISMMWTRNIAIDRKKINNKRLVVGHTPKLIHKIKNSIENGDVIYLDGGAVYNDMKTESGKGNLVAYDFSNNMLHYLENIE